MNLCVPSGVRGIGRADNPTAKVSGLLLQGNQPCLITNAHRARSDDPGVERKLSTEHGVDPTKHIHVLLAGVWVDRGDDTASTDRVDANQGLTNGDGLARHRGLHVRRHTR